MTDMRATERLLEVLHAQLTSLHGSTDKSVSDAAADALDVVCILRRRGDTLVRRDDLRLVLELDEIRFVDSSARSRLENAIGGTL